MSIQLFHIGIKALCKNNEGKYLLLQVNPKKLSGDQPAYWDIPGGRIEENGTVEETLKRELKEELGLYMTGKPEFFTAVVANIKIPTDDGEVGLVLMIYTLQFKDNADIKISDEHISYEWVEPKVAAERLAHKYPVEFTSRF